MSGSGISWAVCKSAPRSRQITTPVPHHSCFLQAGCPSCRPTNSVKALREIYGKTNVGLSLFFWTRCRRPSCQHHNKVWKLCGQSWLSLSSDSALTAAFNSLLSVFFTRSIVSRALGRACQHSRISRLNDSISCNHTSTYDTSASPVTSSRR